MSSRDCTSLVQCAYQECGTAYNTAVTVTLFTWKAFYAQSAAVVGASGYIVLSGPHFAWLAALLLALGACATWYLTRKQMADNQNVIRKAIAAGLHLEVTYPELGCRFKLDAFGDRLDDQETLARLWRGPESVDTTRLGALGVTPHLRTLCSIYVLIYAVFATIALARWGVYLVWDS